MIYPSSREMDMTSLKDLKEQLETAIGSKPETGEQWAHICWLEVEIIREERQEAIDNSQFGVGA